eukprot:jgi/Orpsp1_1/1177462/evm.model.c7180000061531.1
MNDKENDYKEYPLLWAISNENIEMVKLIIKYANENNIVLTINDRNSEGLNSILMATKKNNSEIINLITSYANENDILLED